MASEPPAADLPSLFEPYVWSWFEQRFGAPTPPQVESWPRIAAGQHTLIFSPTGSGKTLAAFLWCLNELYRAGSRGELADSVYVLYVSPLKALNNDIQRNLIEPLEGISRAAEEAGIAIPEVRSEVRTGDTPAAARTAMAARPPHILITTPESLHHPVHAALPLFPEHRPVRHRRRDPCCLREQARRAPLPFPRAPQGAH